MVKPTKMYYSITEVAELLGLKPHILRYWETEFSILHPKKNRAGNRAYRKKDIEVVKLIKQLLYTEGFTIEGAKRQIKKLRDGGYKPGKSRPKNLEARRPPVVKVVPAGSRGKKKIPDDLEEQLKGIRSEIEEIIGLLGAKN